MARISGRVIRIVDSLTVLINLGSDQGITENSIFRILGPDEKIIDPMSQDELGAVTTVKARVKAIQVFEKFTIATSKWLERDNSILALFPSVTGSASVTEIGNPLSVNKSDLQPWQSSGSPVKVGDRVEVTVELAAKHRTNERPKEKPKDDKPADDASRSNKSDSEPQTNN